MQAITQKQLEETIRGSNGKIFRVTFTKKDGTVRTMVCRLGVTSHLRGGCQPYNPGNYGLVTVFDMQQLGYRNINLDTTSEIKINGKVYKVQGDQQ